MPFGKEFSNKVSDLINPSSNAPTEKTKNVGGFGLSNNPKKSSEIEKIEYDASYCNSYADMKHQQDDIESSLDKANNKNYSNYYQYNFQNYSNVPKFDTCTNNDSRILKAIPSENKGADISPLHFSFRNLTESSESKNNGNFNIDHCTVSKTRFGDDKKDCDLNRGIQNSNSTLRESNNFEAAMDICEQDPRFVIKPQTNSPPKNSEFSLKDVNDISQQSNYLNSIYTEITHNNIHFDILNNKPLLEKVSISKTSINNLFVDDSDQNRSPSSSRSVRLMDGFLKSPNDSKKTQEANLGGGITYEENGIKASTAKSAEKSENVHQKRQQDLAVEPTASFTATHCCAYTGLVRKDRHFCDSCLYSKLRLKRVQHQQSAGPCHISQSPARTRNNLHSSSGDTEERSDECQNTSGSGFRPKEGLDIYGLNFRNFKVYSTYSLNDSFESDSFEPKVWPKISKPCGEMEGGYYGDSAANQDKNGCEMKNVDHEEFTRLILALKLINIYISEAALVLQELNIDKYQLPNFKFNKWCSDCIIDNADVSKESALFSENNTISISYKDMCEFITQFSIFNFNNVGNTDKFIKAINLHVGIFLKWLRSVCDSKDCTCYDKDQQPELLEKNNLNSVYNSKMCFFVISASHLVRGSANVCAVPAVHLFDGAQSEHQAPERQQSSACSTNKLQHFVQVPRNKLE
ncbi:hypothetical protein AYI69_g8489 [Smittium culicis]|uniref:Uncharacterized protein n=1 Tax=Smittium culicis TaxID=133412 RepID=A0A1R1XJA1_9FUNG|nr:hypothetical protein AYI69_g8489 [Smittium culicis]